MAQANTHNRHLRCLHHLVEVVNGILAMGWIAGAIGNEDAIKVMGHFMNRIVVRENSHTSSPGDKTSENVFLDTTIDHGDMAGAATGATNMERSFRADSAYQVDLF